MKLFIGLFIFMSLVSKADCPRLEGAPDLPPEIANLLPSDQLVCAKKFYHSQNSVEDDSHFCSCFDRENPMDAVAASTAISAEEDKRLKNLIEDMVIEHAKASLDSFFSNTIYFDAYVRRGALDTRLLANMDKCRLRGFVEKLKNPTIVDGKCNPATYSRRLAKFLNPGSGAPDSAFEAMVKKALTSEEGKDQLFNDYIKNFQESTIPLAKNIIPSNRHNHCMPYKAYMMFSAPPIDDFLFSGTLGTGGVNEDRENTRHEIRNYLHLPSMGAKFLTDVEHPSSWWMTTDNSTDLEYSAQTAGNHPLMLLAFQNDDILQALNEFTTTSNQCQREQHDRYQRATRQEFDRYFNERLAALTSRCAAGEGYNVCRQGEITMARLYASAQIPKQREWARKQNEKNENSEPRCETYKDFFQKQENINEIIKAQNNKCNNFRENIGPEFLCKDDISNFAPKTLELELGPKIFEAFGSDGPRIFNHYMKKYYCSITSEGKGVPKPKIGPSPLEKSGIVDHLRPKSELSDIRTGKESRYDSYNNFLCSKMNGRRPDGSTFSCANNSARPPECNQSIYFKQMACQALKSELDGVTPILSEPLKRDYFLDPEKYGDTAFHKTFPSSRDSLGNGAMILEFQRLANTLPGDLGANCALPNPLPSDSATVSSWFASEEQRIAEGSGSGSGSSLGDSGAAFFSDYFLEGTPTDETHLADFRTANPSITTGVLAPTTPLVAPYERRVEVMPPPSLVAEPGLMPTPIPVPSPDVINDPVLAKATGSFAERGYASRAPAAIATPIANLSSQSDAPVVGPTPAHTPTPNPLANAELEQRRKLEDLERQMRELERREAELAAEGRRSEAERLRAEIEKLKREREALNNSNNGNNNVVKVTPTPGPTPRPIPTGTPVIGDNTGGNQRVGGGGTMPVAGPNKRTLARPGGAASGGSSSGKTRSLASNGGNGQSASLDGFAGKYAKNSRFRAPIEPYEGKPGGLPGIKALKHHLPYESPWVLPAELIKLFGVKKVVMYFHLEGKTFSALEVLGPNEYQIIVYAFNPRDLSKAEIETPVEIDRRMRVKRLLEEMRATPEEAEKNAGAFSTAADNTHELARELLLTERERKMALDQMLSKPVLEKAWAELRHFEVPPAEIESE